MTRYNKCWRAVYSDGRTVTQYTPDGETLFSSLNFARIERFELLSGNKVIVSVNIYPGRELIYYRRCQFEAKLTDTGIEKISEKTVTHHIGYRENGDEIVSRIPDKE